MIAGRVGVAATHAVDSVLAADLCVTCVLRMSCTYLCQVTETAVWWFVETNRFNNRLHDVVGEVSIHLNLRLVLFFDHHLSVYLMY